MAFLSPPLSVTLLPTLLLCRRRQAWPGSSATDHCRVTPPRVAQGVPTLRVLSADSTAPCKECVTPLSTAESPPHSTSLTVLPLPSPRPKGGTQGACLSHSTP